MVALLASQPNTGKSNEWYTPSKYIEAARAVMGAIDLDPASCALANQTVKASRYYTKEDDGLSKPWYGRIWLNPPYRQDASAPYEQRSNLTKWTRKLIEGFQQGKIEQAIALLTAQVNASWFLPLWEYPICFTDHHIRFFLPHKSTKPSKPGRTTQEHMFGSSFVYLGSNEQSFIEHFSAFGRIARAIDTPKPVSKPHGLWEVN